VAASIASVGRPVMALPSPRFLIEQALDALDEKSPTSAAAPAKDIEELFAPLRGLNLDFNRNASGGPVDR
jgi:hypothetical protein